MLRAHAPQSGFTVVEVLVSLTVLSVLLMLGAPAFSEWLQNQQIRSAADAALNGLQVARAEGVRINGPVRFQFVSDLTSSCALTNDPQTAPNWVVSLRDPTGKCDVKSDPSDPANPQIVQSRSNAEGSPNAFATAVFVPAPPAAAAALAATTVTFSSLGNVTANADGTPSIVRIDVTNTNIAADARRPLRIIVNPGGSTRLCDPALAATDPRGCPAWP